MEHHIPQGKLSACEEEGGGEHVSRPAARPDPGRWLGTHFPGRAFLQRGAGFHSLGTGAHFSFMKLHRSPFVLELWFGGSETCSWLFQHCLALNKATQDLLPQISPPLMWGQTFPQRVCEEGLSTSGEYTFHRGCRTCRCYGVGLLGSVLPLLFVFFGYYT